MQRRTRGSASLPAPAERLGPIIFIRNFLDASNVELAILILAEERNLQKFNP